jgi:hypothetical protein
MISMTVKKSTAVYRGGLRNWAWSRPYPYGGVLTQPCLTRFVKFSPCDVSHTYRYPPRVANVRPLCYSTSRDKERGSQDDNRSQDQVLSRGMHLSLP